MRISIEGGSSRGGDGNENSGILGAQHSRDAAEPRLEAESGEEMQGVLLHHGALLGPSPAAVMEIKEEKLGASKGMDEDEAVGAAAGEDIVELAESAEELVGHPGDLDPAAPRTWEELPDADALDDIGSADSAHHDEAPGAVHELGAGQGAGHGEEGELGASIAAAEVEGDEGMATSRR